MAIQNGGIAIATFIQSGGQVFDVGVASASLILNGGLQTVFAQPGFIGIAFRARRRSGIVRISIGRRSIVETSNELPSFSLS